MFVRKGSENVVGPMPSFCETLLDDDNVWKIIAWIRRKIASDASRDSEENAYPKSKSVLGTKRTLRPALA